MTNYTAITVVASGHKDTFGIMQHSTQFESKRRKIILAIPRILNCKL